MIKRLLACAIFVGALAPAAARADIHSRGEYANRLVREVRADGARGTAVFHPDRELRSNLAIAVDDPDLTITEVVVEYTNGHMIAIRPDPTAIENGAALDLLGDRWPVREVMVNYVTRGKDRQNAIQVYAVR
jgi:hypothetical protein